MRWRDWDGSETKFEAVMDLKFEMEVEGPLLLYENIRENILKNIVKIKIRNFDPISNPILIRKSGDS